MRLSLHSLKDKGGGKNRTGRVNAREKFLYEFRRNKRGAVQAFVKGSPVRVKNGGAV